MRVAIFDSTKKQIPPGNDLLSQRCVPPVPSALTGLTSGFGMGPGISPPLKSPEESVFSKHKLRRCYRTLKTEQKVELCVLHTRRFQYINIPRASPRALVVVRSGLTSFTRLPYQGDGLSPRLLCRADGGSNLGACFPLRCFQRLSLPNLATQRCRWHDNWHTSGPSTLVLSY